MKLVYFFTSLLMYIAFSNDVYANTESVVECYNCDQSKTSSAAINWGWTNISSSTLQTPGTVSSKVVTVVDLAQRQASTFEVKKIRLPAAPAQSAVYSVGAVKIQTDVRIQELIDELREADNELKIAAQSLVIPDTVISDAWEFVNCAYCQTRVSEFLNNSTHGKIETMAQVVNHFAQTLGLVQTSLPNIFKLKLESGGQITFKLTLTNHPIELEVQMISVTDFNGNNVPFNSSGLRGLNLHIKNVHQASMINGFLFQYQLFIPVRIGRVTVQDCLLPGSCL